MKKIVVRFVESCRNGDEDEDEAATWALRLNVWIVRKHRSASGNAGLIILPFVLLMISGR